MRLCRLLLPVLFICLCPAASFSGGKHVTFALYDLGFLYNQETDAGIDKDIARELARRSGREFRLVYMPRARIWKDMEQGSIMMTGSGIETPERDKFAWFIPCMAMKNYVISDRAMHIRNIAEMQKNPDFRVGVIRSYKHGKAADAVIDDLKKQGKVTEVAQQQQLYRMLKVGRISAFMALPTASAFYLDRMKMKDSVEITNLFPSDPPIVHSVVFSKKYFSAAEMRQWRKILNEMTFDGTLERIYAGYVGRVYAAEMLKNLPSPH